MALDDYRAKRRLGETLEPGARLGSSAHGDLFVIHKHAARRLHYDIRLELDGVLKSWAVPKGPSLDPADRHLAVHVEDHPLDYADFEGVIPKGEYGGGTVMVWDRGRWFPEEATADDPRAAYRDGHLKFRLEGEKLRGRWMLVRMKPRHDPDGRASDEKADNWLFFKERDDEARSGAEAAVTALLPDSAKTGRTAEQITAAADRVWDPAGPPAARPDPGAVPGARRGPLPVRVEPELATLVSEAPRGDGWLHEIKFDGYRVLCRLDGGVPRLFTRRGADWTDHFPTLIAPLGRLPAASALLDGEVVYAHDDGRTTFAALASALQGGTDPEGRIVYFVFDLLHLDGYNPRNLPLRERKKLLAALLPTGNETLRISEDIAGDGVTIFRHACALHAEGIVSKRADAPYRSARGSDWLKSKCLREQELVIGGFTTSIEGKDRIGSLLLGYYQSGKLIYAGRTGTGFTQKLKRDLLTQLSRLKLKASPFAAVPAAAQRGAVWVRPDLVAQVRFANWTADTLVRQAAFLGLREDKPATEVTREEATVAPKPKSSPATRVSASHHAAAVLKAAKSAPKRTSSDTNPVRLTHPDKVLDPASGLTKRQLADFYLAIAPYMLPHIIGRPLSLVRCPDGADKPCFFQKHVNSTLTPGIGSVSIPDKKTGKIETYITLDNQDDGAQATPEALAGLAQIGVLEIHPWASRNADLEHPDRLIFDLDPDESLPWPTLAAAAAEVRRRLKLAGLESFLKVTGGKGLHVVAPILPKVSWENLKAAAHNLVLSMEREHPGLYLTRMSKAARVGKIFLDYLRNERGATAVAPYSPRARLGVHVSLPVPWSTLQEPALPVFTVRDFAEWKDRLHSDPWKAMPSTVQRLDLPKFDAL